MIIKIMIVLSQRLLSGDKNNYVTEYHIPFAIWYGYLMIDLTYKVKTRQAKDHW